MVKSAKTVLCVITSTFLVLIVFIDRQQLALSGVIRKSAKNELVRIFYVRHKPPDT